MTEEIAAKTSANNWIGSRQTECTYTFDDVVDAFEAGKRKGKTDYDKKIVEKVNSILSDLWDVSIKIDAFLKDNKFSYHNIYLSIETEDFYKLLVPVSESDLLKEEFMATYDFSWGLEETLKKKHSTIDVLFHFSSYNKDTFDSESVICDGYQFKFRDI